MKLCWTTETFNGNRQQVNLVEKTVTDYVPVSDPPVEQSKVKTRYLLDGLNVLVETLVTGEAPTEILTPKAIYVPSVLMAALKETGESEFRFYIPDAQGNVIALSDTFGQITRVYKNDAWGNPLITTATNILGISSTLVVQEDLPNPYQWNGTHGYYYDADVGMYLLGFRWYDAQTGRFISRDPIGFESGDVNYKRYVHNGPTKFTDPIGLIADWVVAVGAVAVAAGIGLGIGFGINVGACSYRVNSELAAAEIAADTYAPDLSKHRTSGPGTNADQLTHCIAACSLARDPGWACGSPYRALEYLQDRERGGGLASQLDRLNNEEGFGIGLSPDFQGLSCINACLTALSRRLLFTIKGGVIVRG
jgi:RHS repeat-associated protein